LCDSNANSFVFEYEKFSKRCGGKVYLFDREAILSALRAYGDETSQGRGDGEKRIKAALLEQKREVRVCVGYPDG
jgi:hypothetical protein